MLTIKKVSLNPQGSGSERWVLMGMDFITELLEFSSNGIDEFIQWICLYIYIYIIQFICSTFKITAQTIKHIGCWCRITIIAMIIDMLHIYRIFQWCLCKGFFFYLYKIMHGTHTIILYRWQNKLYLTMCTTCSNSYSCFQIDRTFLYNNSIWMCIMGKKP